MSRQRIVRENDSEVRELSYSSTSNLMTEDLLRIQYELFLALSQVRDMDETKRLCLASSLRVSAMDSGGIYLVSDMDDLANAWTTGWSDNFNVVAHEFSMGTDNPSATGVVEPVYLHYPTLEKVFGDAVRREQLQVLAILPIQHDKRVIGCLMAGSHVMDEIPLRTRLALETIVSVVGLFIHQAQADEVLRDSEARFFSTFEQAAVGIAHVSPEGRWLRVNRKLCQIVGYSSDELVGLTFQDITYPEDLLVNLDSVRRLLNGEVDSYANEKRYIRKDGGVVWVNVTVTLTRKENNEPDYFISVIEDIHARKQAEDALRLFSRVIEQTASSVVVTDIEGRVEYVNPRFLETTGYAAHEILGKRPNVLKSGYTSPEEYRRLWSTIKGGEVWKGEFHNRRKDGSLYWESAIISPVRNEYGEITHFVGIKDDVTERKSAEAALKESEADLKKAQQQAHIGNGKWDIHTGQTMWSDELYTIFGLDPALPSLSHHELAQYFTPESWRRISMAVERVMTCGEPYDMDVEVVRADDSHRWVHARGEAGYDDGGTVIELRTMLQDITERKILEQQIIEVSTAQQERIGREIHDGIGQQLTALGMLANSLERKLKQAKRLRDARTAGDLARYLQQALGEAKSLARGLSPIRIGQDGLADALGALVDGARNWANIHCHLTISGDIGIADENVAVHLYRITQESINNAIKHAQAHNVFVTLKDDDQVVALNVRDDGVGMDANVNSNGLGLHIMRYRAGLIGASLAITAIADGGTLVECIWHKHA